MVPHRDDDAGWHPQKLSNNWIFDCGLFFWVCLTLSCRASRECWHVNNKSQFLTDHIAATQTVRSITYHQLVIMFTIYLFLHYIFTKTTWNCLSINVRETDPNENLISVSISDRLDSVMRALVSMYDFMFTYIVLFVKAKTKSKPRRVTGWLTHNFLVYC